MYESPRKPRTRIAGNVLNAIRIPCFPAVLPPEQISETEGACRNGNYDGNFNKHRVSAPFVLCSAPALHGRIPQVGPVTASSEVATLPQPPFQKLDRRPSLSRLVASSCFLSLAMDSRFTGRRALGAAAGTVAGHLATAARTCLYRSLAQRETDAPP